MTPAARLKFTGLLVATLLLFAESRGKDVLLGKASATVGNHTLTLTMALFSEQDFDIRVIDNSERKFDQLATAMDRLTAAAGANGGAFKSQTFTPVSMVIASGKRTGSLDKLSRANGIFAVINGKPTLLPRSQLKDFTGITEFLQGGPWVIYDGEREPSKRESRLKRTFIATDGNGNWALGVSDPCSLTDLAIALQRPVVSIFVMPKYVLCLDGGDASAFWCKTKDGVTSIKEDTTGPNYIGIFPR
jgi:hypothetical protein